MKYLFATVLILISSFCSAGYSRVELQKVHTESLRHFEFVSDIEQYGVTDKWVTNCSRGDCEDYALCLYNKVGGTLAIVKTFEGEYHIVLIIDGYVMDNTRRGVYIVEDMPHKMVVLIPHTSIYYKL